MMKIFTFFLIIVGGIVWSLGFSIRASKQTIPVVIENPGKASIRYVIGYRPGSTVSFDNTQNEVIKINFDQTNSIDVRSKSLIEFIRSGGILGNLKDKVFTASIKDSCRNFAMLEFELPVSPISVSESVTKVDICVRDEALALDQLANTQ